LNKHVTLFFVLSCLVIETFMVEVAVTPRAEGVTMTWCLSWQNWLTLPEQLSLTHACVSSLCGRVCNSDHVNSRLGEATPVHAGLCHLS
jgi:hypothetical protein